MIVLLNSRGQIGDKLSALLCESGIEQEVYIYHTWDIEDKSYESQRKEYIKFKNFVSENWAKRIIFISTNSQKENYYVKFKQLSEAYLVENCQTGLVLKFPTLIGKGVFYDFKNRTKEPYGRMSVMTIERACEIIVDNINYNGLLRSKSFEGHEIDAKIVYELVKI